MKVIVINDIVVYKHSEADYWMTCKMENLSFAPEPKNISIVVSGIQ